MGNLIITTFKGLFLVLYIVFIFSCIALSDAIMMISIPVLLVSRSYFRKITNAIAHFGWPLITLAFETLGRNKLVFTGDSIKDYQNFDNNQKKVLGKDRNALVLINHTYHCDWLLSFSLGERSGRIGNIKIAMKDIIKYVPFAGIGIWAMGFIFLSRKWQNDQPKINKAYEHLRKDGEPFWFVTHPEGSRVSEKNLKESQEFSRSRGLPILENLLIPRVKGFTSSVVALHDQIDAVYDLTVAYKKKPGNIFRLLYGANPTEIHVHVRRFPISSIPVNDIKGVEQWLYKTYQEKDRLLKSFKENGYFSDGKFLDQPFKPQKYLKNLFVWIISLLIFFTILINLYFKK
ncbi:hypothetical protein DDB_G0288523 [Dictyostelium discoideum AX4]|uniref:Phospholipid/glycerol acyltransferase domain-containing protein n=1 Tax=Dictyostelium discoideum TaxID=44689 RepID=Q54IT8_DICDI|nr:hypothetical protein DDB_G0288523 [Dictyostelium discoideum AX4]EAL63183.1 hypothetical protein DDB_G0288523 [Dictyostelium discoideum AX4]|eukprot:XP_636688.1 hypothetical protein DDB_G0288523 [Dictyostelium discoideum AX4]